MRPCRLDSSAPAPGSALISGIAANPSGFAGQASYAACTIGNPDDDSNRLRSTVDKEGIRPLPPKPKTMTRFWKTIFLAIIIVGGLWILLNQDRIQKAGGLTAFIEQSLKYTPLPTPRWSTDNSEPRWQETAFRFSSSNNQTDVRQRRPYDGNQRFDSAFKPALGIPRRLSNTIRIASFKMNAASAQQPDPHATHVLTHICSQFDIVAFQEIDGRSDAWLAQISQSVATQTNGAVTFRALSDRSKIETGQPQFAILFNTNTLDLDQSQWYSVNDPDDLLARAPLVGWFRAKKVPTSDAFTFTLANIQLDSHRPDLELGYIGELFRAIRNDGRGEDDVIIVGNFNAGDRGLSPLRKKAGLNWVVFDTPTSTDKTNQVDNLVFSQTATIEFTGQGGVLDFLAAYNLRYDQAIAISEHMPIWAEFSAVEGNEDR